MVSGVDKKSILDLTCTKSPLNIWYWGQSRINVYDWSWELIRILTNHYSMVIYMMFIFSYFWMDHHYFNCHFISPVHWIKWFVNNWVITYFMELYNWIISIPFYYHYFKIYQYFKNSNTLKNFSSLENTSCVWAHCKLQPI